MQDLPHHYTVSAEAATATNVSITSKGLSPIESAAPAEFGGPGDRWSPESLLVAAVADCFVLTFKAIARASRLEWQQVSCDVEGVLDRLDGKTQFTALNVSATLTVPPGTDPTKARRLLEKAEHGCLVTNSMTAKRELTTKVAVGSDFGSRTGSY